MAWSSMNSGDCFILDLGLTIYVWNGASAGKMEKIKALDVARRIRDEERGGRAALEVMGMLESKPESCVILCHHVCHSRSLANLYFIDPLLCSLSHPPSPPSLPFSPPFLPPSLPPFSFPPPPFPSLTLPSHPLHHDLLSTTPNPLPSPTPFRGEGNECRVC